MRFRNILITVLGALVLGLGASGAPAAEGGGAREEGVLLEASQVMEELRAQPDKGIPDALLERAYGIAIFPGLMKAAFFFGGRHGDGVFIERDKRGQYTSPFFISITGGSFGLQFGGAKEDIVLIFTTRSGVEGVTGGKIALGGDISVALGPVGREAAANTDFSLAQVYSYSKAKGLFGGVAFDGSVITVDGNSNAAYYKKPGVLSSEISAGSVRMDDEGSRRFIKAVSVAYKPEPHAAAPRPAKQAPAAQPAASAAPAPAASAAPAAAGAAPPPPK